MKSWVSALILQLVVNMQAAPEARRDLRHVGAARPPCPLRWRLEQLVLRGGVDDQRLQQTWKDVSVIPLPSFVPESKLAESFPTGPRAQEEEEEVEGSCARRKF